MECHDKLLPAGCVCVCKCGVASLRFERPEMKKSTQWCGGSLASVLDCSYAKAFLHDSSVRRP
ncbi:hypothetical protein C8Q79DRAFT_981571 [Trametes meyenii]|nr:hypothetical protein C8Q79DRAFT_981571 [Trametes meyenii]